MASIPAQEEFLAATRKSQEAMIAAIKTWLETIRTATPKLTSVYGRLPKLPLAGLPFADKLPTPEEAVDSAYHMAEQLLANQRKFTEDLLEAMTPLIPGRSEAAPRGNGWSWPKVPSQQAWHEAVTEPKPVAVSEPKPAAASAEPKAPAHPAAKSTPARPPRKTAASAAKSTAPTSPASKSTTAKSTAAKSTAPRSPASKSTTAKGTTAKSTPGTTSASQAPKGTDAS